MKILMAYEHYPVSIGRFWKRGFEALGCTVHSMGHCTHGKISWGDYDLSKWTDQPQFEIGNFSNVYDVGDATQMISRHYDLFVNVDAAHWWRGSLPIPKVIVGTDPHCLSYESQRHDCDFFVCMQRTYSAPRDVWIPYAYDEEWHHVDHGVPTNDHDVTFWGVEYAERTRDLDRLQGAGLRVVRGTGRVFDETAADYSSAPFAYCRPSRLDLPTRFFEAMAHMSIPLITDIPELQYFPEFVRGRHYVVFDDQNLVDVVRRELSDLDLDQRRREVLRLVQPHSWRMRAAQLLQECAARNLIDLSSREPQKPERD
jgi:hypothetical protein